MAVNGKNKGNTFERKIANLLSDRFAEHTGLAKAFRRNADSGSFFGGSNSNRTQTHDTEKATFGDIITPATFRFSIECKHYKDPPSFSMMMKQDCKMLDGWIKQAEQDAESSEKEFLIIMKFNLVDEVAVVKTLPPNTTAAVINYKGYFLIPLTQLLDNEDGFFFV